VFFAGWSSSIVLLQVLIGCVLLIAGIAKFVGGIQSFVQVVRQYRLLPSRLAALTGWAIATAELGVGTFLFAGRMVPVCSALAAMLFGAFAFGIAANLARGRTDISCGCFGATESRISWWLVARNVVAAFCALLIVRISPHAPPSQIDRVDASLIVLGLIGICILLQVFVRLYRLPVPKERLANRA